MVLLKGCRGWWGLVRSGSRGDGGSLVSQCPPDVKHLDADIRATAVSRAAWCAWRHRRATAVASSWAAAETMTTWAAVRGTTSTVNGRPARCGVEREAPAGSWLMGGLAGWVRACRRRQRRGKQRGQQRRRRQQQPPDRLLEGLQPAARDPAHPCQGRQGRRGHSDRSRGHEGKEKGAGRGDTQGREGGREKRAKGSVARRLTYLTVGGCDGCRA